MVEHAAVNRVVVGSSPTFGANFTREEGKPSASDTKTTQERPDSETDNMRFPKRIRHRGQMHATIYGKSASYPAYRLAWRVAGKRRMERFQTYSEAKRRAEELVKELAKGSQVTALTGKEAAVALSIRDALDAFRRDNGRSYSALEAVTGFLDVVKQLPEGCNPTEAARAYSRTLATVKPKLIADAVKEFLAVRKPKAQAVNGKRAQLSPVYAKHIETWSQEFAATFPGHRLGDLNRDFLARYIESHAELSPKSRNDRRAAVAMLLRWCARQDYLPQTHRLLEADAMQKEQLDTAATDFYRPAEFRALLEAAEGPMRAVIALQGLAGLRLEEALRLTWANVFTIPGHVEITAQNAKTRRRRLVEICPALAGWLEPFRAKEGRVWDQTATLNGFVSAFSRLRGPLKIPSRRNGLRHAFITFYMALHNNENLVAALAGTSPSMVHQHYRGLAVRSEAEKWFTVRPADAPANVVPMSANS
jgi:integrase